MAHPSPQDVVELRPAEADEEVQAFTLYGADEGLGERIGVRRPVRDLEQPYVAPDALADINDSMTRGWKLLEYLPLPAKGEGLKMTRARLRRLPAGARIHASVITRAEAAGQLPTNLPSDHRVEGGPPDQDLV